MSIRLRIAKEFTSIQGEGAMTGLPMYFVRTAGCSISECPLHPSVHGICDTDWSFRYDDTPESVHKRATNSLMRWMCVTGGEPTDQLDAINELAFRARQLRQRTMIQTSGVRTLPYYWDYIAVSPKGSHEDLKIKNGNELKVVWNGQSLKYFEDMMCNTDFEHYFVQPLCLPNGTNNIQECAGIVLQLGMKQSPWKLGIQQHKIVGCE